MNERKRDKINEDKERKGGKRREVPEKNKIGEKDNAILTYKKALDISIGVSKKLDLTFTLLHIYLE